MIQKIFKTILGNNKAEREAELYRDLIRHEAKIGGELFGPIPKGGRREFFCLDKRTWVWHEEWTDDNGQQHSKTTRYDVRPNAIFKAQDGSHYKPVSEQEAKHLKEAAVLYEKRIRSKIYNHIN